MKTKSRPKARVRAGKGAIIPPLQKKGVARARVSSEQRAKLFKNGSSQAVRLPKEFRFPGREVLIRREGKAVVLEPVEKFDWQAWWDSWTAAGDDFMPNGREDNDIEPRIVDLD